MKNILSSLTKSEKSRILEMHKKSTSRHYLLKENQITPFCEKFKSNPTQYQNCLCPSQVEPGDVVKLTYKMAVKVNGTNSFSFKTLDGNTVKVGRPAIFISDGNIVKLDSNRRLPNDSIFEPSCKFISNHFKIPTSINGIYVDGRDYSDYSKLSKNFPDIFRSVGSISDNVYGYSVNLSAIPGVKMPVDVITKYFVGYSWTYDLNGTLSTLYSENTSPNVSSDFIKKFNSRIV